MTAEEIVEKWVGTDIPHDTAMAYQAQMEIVAGLQADIEAAIEAEREACAKIGDDRIEEINRTYPAQPGSSPEWDEKAIRLTEANHYRNMIRARGEAKEGEE